MNPRRASPFSAAGWVFLLAAVACRAPTPQITLPAAAPSPSPAPAAPLRDTMCTVAAGPAVPHDSVVVALMEPVDPAHAPVPQNDAERLVFSQLYETLVDIDCAGRILPGLAGAWTSTEGGRRWTFTLRQDAHFWDGAPVTARDVLAAWLAQDSALLRFPWFPRAVSAPNEHVISILLPAPDTGGARMLGAATLAVYKPAPDRSWPVGTAPLWVTGGTASARRIAASPLGGRPYPAVAFLLLAGSDARDALDGGADLLVTSDPAVLDYAASRAEFVSVPLEWERTYVLLAPASAGPAGPDLEDLGHAVHVDARPADRFFWWWRLTGCELPAPAAGAADGLPTPPPGRARRLVYDRSDRVARDLADRLVARALVGRGTVAAGLASDAIAASLDAASDFGYVVALDRRAPDRCRQVQQFLAADRSGRTALIPLLDTRRHAIVRRGLSGLSVDWHGTLRLVPR